ncbi:hypothetical protein D3C78_1180400 [compost metagenome]
MDNRDILMLDIRSGEIGESYDRGSFSLLDVYELPHADLSAYKCLVINGSVDQEFLLKHKGIIHRFLDSGKVLLYGGHLFRPWLPGGSDFIPRTIRGHRDYDITIVQADPLFEGVDPYDLTYNKGVAGFFARGHHPLPQGAEALLTLPGGEPTLYIDRSSTRGTLMVSSGNILLGYQDESRSTGQIGRRVVQWIYDEYARIQKGRGVS